MGIIMRNRECYTGKVLFGSYEVKVGHASNVSDAGSARYPLGIQDNANVEYLVLSAKTKTNVNVSPCFLPYKGVSDGNWYVKMVSSSDMSAVTGKTIDIDFTYIEIPT